MKDTNMATPTPTSYVVVYRTIYDDPEAEFTFPIFLDVVRRAYVVETDRGYYPITRFLSDLEFSRYAIGLRIRDGDYDAAYARMLRALPKPVENTKPAPPKQPEPEVQPSSPRQVITDPGLVTAQDHQGSRDSRYRSHQRQSLEPNPKIAAMQRVFEAARQAERDRLRESPVTQKQRFRYVELPPDLSQK